MSQSPSSAAKTSPDKSTPRSPWLLILIFRLLLLVVGGGIAAIAGIVLANFYPNPNPEKPILLEMLERFDRKPPATPPSPSPTSVSSTSNPPRQLTPVQRQQAQAQLTQLQAQLKAVSDGVVTLEAQLGTSRPNESLEARLQAMSLQLQGIQAPSANASTVGNPSTSQLASSSESLIRGDKLKVTLPSDVLFQERDSILRPEAGLILDKIIADLRDYPSSTIRIAAHTDAALEAEDNRELSFRRAQAVQQYLARALGDRYRWLVVGYGATRPLIANDTASNQQRNRRIEIAVN